MKIGLREISIACFCIGVAMVYSAFAFFPSSGSTFSALVFMGAMIALGLPLTLRYQKLKDMHAIEEKFPEFLRDVTSTIETGMTLPQAIRTVSRNDYGPLSKYVKEMSAKLDWGIGFEKVLENFSESVGSMPIRRSIKTINETHRSGGYIGTVLEAVAESQTILERIKKERSSSIYAQMINGYVIFFVFLGVMYGLSNFLIPAFQFQGGGNGLVEVYNEIFGNLIIIQGLFAGLSIGKMAEGSIFAGVKHALVMVAIGYTLFTFL